MSATALGVVYVLAGAVANVLVSRFGPPSAPWVALVFVGLDLATRDALHERWEGRGLWGKMLALVVAGSLLSAATTPGSARVAVASALSFGACGAVDAVVYAAWSSPSRVRRANASNVVSALVDSLLFPLLAFGALSVGLFLGQVFAKVVGGLVWSFVLLRREEVEHAAYL